MDYKIENKIYPVKIVKKNNKNTYIRVRNDVIYVTTNYFVMNGDIKKLLDKNYNSIVLMLSKSKKDENTTDGFYYLGNLYKAVFVNTNSVYIDGNDICAKDIKMLNKWYKEKIVDIFKNRLEYWYQTYEEDIPYPILKIRKMSTRWGVCNRRDNSVTLNTNLMRFSIKEIDYVIIHELAHFVHFNHSKDFWNTVSKYEPRYKEIRKVMRS